MGLEAAIDEAIAQNNIDLILTALMETQLYAVCTEGDGAIVPWFVPSLENPNIAVITVSEHTEWLENAFAGNPVREKMLFKPMAGEDIAAMGMEDRIEVYIQFESRAYKIPRRNFEYWASAAGQ